MPAILSRRRNVPRFARALSATCPPRVPRQVTFLASPAYVRNPHLRAKFIHFLQQLVPHPDLPEAAAALVSANLG